MKNIRSFTLIELIVSLSLIVLISSFLTINIKKAIDKYNFEYTFKNISSHIELFKKKAFTDQEDITLIFYQDTKNSYLKVIHSKNAFKEKHIFKNASFKFNENYMEEIEIIFSATNRIYPEGELKFHNLKLNKTKILILKS
ncbi:MAG: hypothetical protein A3F40_04815 [Chlamydiae bacterium RIFCSPHIGHO2_12_FULL_27_8]|nr:MAG: hypothetical protein A3F40_04815 [Chlamydiae bacterium RIFCSPHIGHO2_12_FULL_27_8]OGN65461.1 MAG: hypothetical protein A2888_01535 [Chlamydiae bacterium RIFCSPLOWO2_01_FULL_28_7]